MPSKALYDLACAPLTLTSQAASPHYSSQFLRDPSSFSGSFNMLSSVPENALLSALAAILSACTSLNLSLEATSTEKPSLVLSPKQILSCACLRFSQFTYSSHRDSNSLVQVSPDSIYLSCTWLFSVSAPRFLWCCRAQTEKERNLMTHDPWPMELLGDCFSLLSLGWIVLKWTLLIHLFLSLVPTPLPWVTSQNTSTTCM